MNTETSSYFLKIPIQSIKKIVFIKVYSKEPKKYPLTNNHEVSGGQLHSLYHEPCPGHTQYQGETSSHLQGTAAHSPQ